MKLSPTQARIWRAIGHLEARGINPPTWREVVDYLGYHAVGALGKYVDELRYACLLDKGDRDRHRCLRIARGVTVLSDGSVLRGPWDPFDGT